MPTPAHDAPQPWCDWCGRAIEQQDGRWIAVKGAERGYDPVACEANADGGTHEPAENDPPSVETACTHDGSLHTWREGCPR